MSQQRGTKRKLALSDDGGDKNKFYRFKILLPNRTTVELKLPGLKSEAPFDEFIYLVKDEYLRAQRQSPMKKMRSLNWNDRCLYLEDENGGKITHKIIFANFKPYKCHILRLHVSIYCI